MKNRTIRFLTASLISISVICVLIFAFLASYMSKKNAEAISEIGTIYMSGMNERIAMHFETTMDVRLDRLEDISNSTPPGSIVDYEAAYRTLAYSASVRNFNYLALCSGDGTLEMLYGDQIELADPKPFTESLKNGEKKVALGINESGEEVMIFGIPVEYVMRNGKNSAALVGGLPVEYIKKLLVLDGEDSVVYSHVISRDGNFVIRSGDAVRDNYFDRIREVFNENKGKNAGTYISELKNAMENEEDYSTVLYIGEERRHLYCTDLPYSEWFLVTIMPYGIVDETISGLSGHLVFMLLGSCGIILLALLFIFAEYFSMTRRQIQEIEKARQEAVAATKAKSEFLSNMSHDIRTPMNAIVGMTTIATANIDDRQQVQNCLKKITVSSKHLLGLINDILDMSKIESGKMTLNMEQISLREVMDSVVSIVQPQIKAKKQNFDVFIHDIDTEDVYCDSVRLNQVIINFLSNATKFTPEGGSVQVSLYEEESPVGDDYVRVHLRVKDSGIGMSADFKDKIFESFVREDNKRVHKTEGSGLGMAITKYIVDAMKGTIEVESEQGKGSEFHVTLDLEKAETREEEMILPDWNMLVVDDDEQLCRSAIGSLKDIGIKADFTLDGESALKMIHVCHDKNDDYQIILLDWKLPGMDGIETAREIRRQMGNDIPILLISAYDWSEIEAEAREAGISGFISKPLFKSTLYYGLKSYIGAVDELQEQRNESEINFNGRSILLAEDNDLNWEIAEALLSNLGIKPERAENGRICVDKFKQSPVNAYDAVLMDIRMPEITGYEAAKAIRASGRPDADIPIIAMTADAFAEDIRKCLDCGMNAHVAKPIDVREVARLLEKYIKD